MKEIRGILNFTLIELLIVIAVIAILAGLLLPSLRIAKEAAKKIKCAGNLKQVNSLLYLYTGDYDGWIPESYNSNPSPEGTYWFDRFENYNDSFKTIKGRAGIYSCPLFPRWWRATSHGNYAMNEIFNTAYYGFVKVERVQKPSSLAMFLDGMGRTATKSWPEFGIARFRTAADFGTYPYFYHLNATNVIFFGGNCGSYKMTDAQELNRETNNELWKYPYK